MPLRILITNITLASRTGTEIYVRDLALGLLRRGHDPIVYTPEPGQIASELKQRGIAVLDDLRHLAVPPDIIHGHHHYEVVTALCHFPEVPALFVCHGRTSWFDAPPLLPRVRRFVAVDDCCRDRLSHEHGLPEDRIRVLLNAVDLERCVRREPLPARPRRAVVFSNYAREDGMLGILRAACARHGIALDVIGSGTGTSATEPETLLPSYDLAFAKARCALEALACGLAVILFNGDRMGPLVRAADLARLRRLNLGLMTLDRPVRLEEVLRQIDMYEAADAARVCDAVRATASLDDLLDEYIHLYHEVIEEQGRSPARPADEGTALAAYLRHTAPGELRKLVAAQEALIERQRAELASRDDQGATCARMDADRHRLQGHLDRLHALPILRVRRWMGRLVRRTLALLPAMHP